MPEINQILEGAFACNTFSWICAWAIKYLKILNFEKHEMSAN